MAACQSQIGATATCRLALGASEWTPLPDTPAFSPIPADTTPEAHRVQGEAYRRMGGAARVALAFELGETVRQLTLAGIRHRHPDYTDEQVRLAYARLTLGDELVRAAWPNRDLVTP